MWKSTNPPAAGDFCASVERATDFRRAWSGAAWSAPWHYSDPDAIVARARATPSEQPELIEWLDGTLVAESSDGATVAA